MEFTNKNKTPSILPCISYNGIQAWFMDAKTYSNILRLFIKKNTGTVFFHPEEVPNLEGIATAWV
jgi:hypothetical protein